MKLTRRKKILIIIILVILIPCIFLVSLAHFSRSAKPLLSQSNLLRKCPSSPNCVCSESSEYDLPSYIEPLPYKEQDKIIESIELSIEETGGEVKDIKDNYIHAIYSSKLFGFLDDLEVRIDLQNQIIHFRSASRMGHSDMNANRKRVEALKHKIKNNLN